jgi:hypothetical protein
MYCAACYKTALTPITPQDLGHADGQGVGITTGTTKTVEGLPNQREPQEFALSGHDANANYNDTLLYQSHQAALGHPVSMSQALFHICSTPLALTAHLPWDWRLPPNNQLPFEQIARFDLGHLAFLARGGLWEFHLSVRVRSAALWPFSGLDPDILPDILWGGATCLCLSYTRHWLGGRSPLGRAAALLARCPPPTTVMR